MTVWPLLIAGKVNTDSSVTPSNVPATPSVLLMVGNGVGPTVISVTLVVPVELVALTAIPEGKTAPVLKPVRVPV